MEIVYLGQASFRFRGKSQVVVTDPFGDKAGKYPKDVEASIVTVSHDHFDHNEVSKVKGMEGKPPFVIDGAGEYEISGVSVVGVRTFHDDKGGEERGVNTLFIIEMEGLRIVHAGDLGHKLNADQLSEIGPVDIALLPVGGNYTIDAKGAVEVLKQLDPWIVIPMHYAQEGINIEGLSGVGDFLKEMSVPDLVPVPKLVISAEKVPEELQVVVLEKR